MSGGLVHAHTRDPFLASLPKEALEALSRSYDEVLVKYATPAVDVAQDGPHNQKESNGATNVIDVVRIWEPSKRLKTPLIAMNQTQPSTGGSSI